MERLEALKKAEELLDKVLKDKANLEMALDQWPEAGRDDYRWLESAKWQLVYIYNDEDIRSKEPSYEKAQFEKLWRIYRTIQERIKSIK
ncbi:MAG: hypothetical protein LV481_02225 [Methylacidiphilales bacterium]|nr:hypothetical protein [Candidatus Methylacidiphilales bacterium]